MTRRLLSLLLAALLCLSPLWASAAGTEPKTALEAVGEMTWGANLADLYMVDLPRTQGTTTGYATTAPYGIACWAWNNTFSWVRTVDIQDKEVNLTITLPRWDGTAYDWLGLMTLRVMTTAPGRTVRFALSDSKFTVGARPEYGIYGTEVPYPQMDGEYTLTTGDEADLNGFYSAELKVFSDLEPSSQYSNATFSAHFRPIQAGFSSPADKVDYYFAYERTPFDQECAANIYLNQGANVLRLPVTWTPFVNDVTFAIDPAWMEAVRSEVDYILSKGAYCILNVHDDYLQRAFVATQGSGGTWENFHWERYWMLDDYKAYTDARFRAIWTQIAGAFKDYPQTLIFESCNEPIMSLSTAAGWGTYAPQEQRVNELNDIFVDVVRASGGANATRLLCLAVAEYNTYPHLPALEVPENDDYIIAQLHSYDSIESSGSGDISDYQARTDELFGVIAQFRAAHPKVPVLMGEVGVSHRSGDAPYAGAVGYYFQKARQAGVPCLWWEDFFPLTPGYNPATYFWLYDKTTGQWYRPNILQAIKTALELGDTPPGQLLPEWSSGAQANTYTTQYYLEKADGSGYALAHQEVTAGTPGATVTAPTRSFEHFTENTGKGVHSGTVVTNGSLTLSRYYDLALYSIQFDVNGGSGISPIIAKYGAAVSAPTPPTKAGYTFAGWYADDALTQPYTFSTVPGGNITVYAKWLPQGGGFPYLIDGITLLDDSYQPISAIPKGGFYAQVSVTNLSSTATDALILATYDSGGGLLDTCFLYANPQIGQTFVLGTHVKNQGGAVAQLKAFMLPMLGSLTPLAQAAEFPAR